MLNITNVQRLDQTTWEFEIEGQEMYIQFDLESSHVRAYVYNNAQGGWNMVGSELTIQIIEELDIDYDDIADWDQTNN